MSLKGPQLPEGYMIKKYLDKQNNSVITVFPWQKRVQEKIAKNPKRYLQQFEEKHV